ncbi:polysaccharide deacetylase family protein [Candidatus Shapirobacteria bacterium]|nr:polysaccharide deacetylase family protein [Candidatus Shapirobacteria bacterium]
MKKLAGIILLLTVFFVGLLNSKHIYRAKLVVADAPVVPTLTPTLIPTPSIKVLSFEEMNKYYGPCVVAPTLMYHHIQPEVEAKTKGQGGLSISPDWLRKHLEYLRMNGYTIIDAHDLNGFFDNGLKLPNKPVIITWDDAYEDNYSFALPIIREQVAKVTLFTPTGLVTNPDYLNWEQIREMAGSGLVYFGNHTWSHQSMKTTAEKIREEIGTADKQLVEHGLNSHKVFAYPYGSYSKLAEEELKRLGYGLAFGTKSGKILCKGMRLDLPRVRVGNAPLSRYGI